MISIRDLIWIAIFFVAILIILMLLRPVWILQRDTLTGRPVNDIDATKLIGWSLLFTAILGLIFYIVTRSHSSITNTKYNGELIL